VVGHTSKTKTDEAPSFVRHSNMMTLEVENVALWLCPRVTFSTSGPSHLYVRLTTAHHLYIVLKTYLDK